MKRSKISSSTSRWRSSGRSILLIATIGRSPCASALLSTNLVCGSGPSAASTRITSPSTMDRMRSTSPPKSAWPGVSTMLMRVSFQTSEVTFAKMVMPRSRSRSLESMARSSTRWFSRNEPDCLRSTSIRVVLPWSTWAMIAMLRNAIGGRLRWNGNGLAAHIGKRGRNLKTIRRMAALRPPIWLVGGRGGGGGRHARPAPVVGDEHQGAAEGETHEPGVDQRQHAIAPAGCAGGAAARRPAGAADVEGGGDQRRGEVRGVAGGLEDAALHRRRKAESPQPAGKQGDGAPRRRNDARHGQQQDDLRGKEGGDREIGAPGAQPAAGEIAEKAEPAHAEQHPRHEVLRHAGKPRQQRHHIGKEREEAGQADGDDGVAHEDDRAPGGGEFGPQVVLM